MSTPAAPPPEAMMTADGRCPTCRRKHGYITVDLGTPSDNPYGEQMASSHPACKTSACPVGSLREFVTDPGAVEGLRAVVLQHQHRGSFEPDLAEAFASLEAWHRLRPGP